MVMRFRISISGARVSDEVDERMSSPKKSNERIYFSFLDRERTQTRILSYLADCRTWLITRREVFPVLLSCGRLGGLRWMREPRRERDGEAVSLGGIEVVKGVGETGNTPHSEI